MNSVDLWYRRTFRLPPNHPLYLDTTLEERLAEYWAWQYTENPKLLDTVEDESFDMEELQRQWAEEAGEEADDTAIIKPKVLPPAVEDEEEIDDWEDV